MLYESTGVETRFTNLLDPEPRSRRGVRLPPPGDAAEWAELGAAGECRAQTDIGEDGAAYDTGPRASRADSNCSRQRSMIPICGPPSERRSPTSNNHCSEQAARPDPDGDRLRQDLHRDHRRSTG